MNYMQEHMLLIKTLLVNMTSSLCFEKKILISLYSV